MLLLLQPPPPVLAVEVRVGAMAVVDVVAAWGICTRTGQLLHHQPALGLAHEPAAPGLAWPLETQEWCPSSSSPFLCAGESLSLRVDVDRGLLAVCRCTRPLCLSLMPPLAAVLRRPCVLPWMQQQVTVWDLLICLRGLPLWRVQ